MARVWIYYVLRCLFGWIWCCFAMDVIVSNDGAEFVGYGGYDVLFAAIYLDLMEWSGVEWSGVEWKFGKGWDAIRRF